MTADAVADQALDGLGEAASMGGSYYAVTNPNGRTASNGRSAIPSHGGFRRS
jgi:hypothetical protein